MIRSKILSKKKRVLANNTVIKKGIESIRYVHAFLTILFNQY